MNNKISKQLEKVFITVMIFMILAASLFIFTSCKSDYRKIFEGDTLSAPAESTTYVTTDTGAATDSQTGASETAAVTTSPKTQQIVTVTADSGGYSPRKIDARAGVPTILIMKSEGAYGCERAFNIPDLNISEILPENGQTEFDLGTQAKGTKLLGVCSMGMYNFQIFFN